MNKPSSFRVKQFQATALLRTIPGVTTTAVGLLVVCLLALFCPQLAQAHTGETISSLQITNYTGYIISSDGQNNAAGYERDAIRCQATVQYTTSSNTITAFDYQLVFRLLDPAGQPVSILETNGQAGTTYTLSSTITLPYLFQNARTVTYGAAIKPAVRLNLYQQYQLELRLYERPFNTTNKFTYTGDVSTEGPALFVHFPSLDSSDAALNVVARLQNVTFQRAYAVQTMPAKDHFVANANFALRRYDAFAEPVSTAGVFVRFDYELRNTATGEVIPLVNSNKVVTK